MTAIPPAPLLVSGAGGHLGGLVVQSLLTEYGIAPQHIIAATRTPQQLTELSAIGVDVRYADFDEPDTLATAFSGAQRMLLIATSAIFPAETRSRQRQTAIDAAIAAGVNHIVYTSGLTPEVQTPMFWNTDHWDTEQHLLTRACSSTILRFGEYMELHVGDLWPATQHGAHVYTVEGDGRCVYVAQRDCARVAAAVLASDTTQDDIFTVTGPQALTIDEALAVTSEVIGRDLKAVHVGAEEFTRVLHDGGAPRSLIDCYLALEQGIALGHYVGVSDTVERITGQPAMSFGESIAALVPAALSTTRN